MNRINIGNLQISRVPEINPLSVPAAAFFPDITAGIIKSASEWLPLNFFDPANGLIYLSFHSYVLRTPSHNILIDTCNGNCKSRDLPRVNMLQTSYLQELKAAGFNPEDIGIVICTHLHPDHVGWNTQRINGNWMPTFPKARYLMGRVEYAHWQKLNAANPSNPVLRGAFADSILPIIESDQAELVESDHVIENSAAHKIWLESSAGHSPGHVSINVKSGLDRAIFSGDVIHHAIQLAYPDLWTAADFDAVQATRSRRALLENIADTSTILLTAHFPSPTAGYVVRHGDAFRFKFY